MARVTRRSMLGGLAATGISAGVSRASASQVRYRPAPSTGVTREYWVQIDSLSHDLCPSGQDDLMGDHINFPHVMTALVYRAFTPNWGAPLPGDGQLGPNTGFPGPVLRANVGDTLVVHLRNNDTYYKKPHSMHPHGVSYTPAHDGTWIATAYKPGGLVLPGRTFTYIWTAQSSSVGTWPYHDHSQPFVLPGSSPSSHMSMDDDEGGNMEISASLGLMGQIVISDPAETPPDREFYLVMHDMYASDIPQLAGDIDCFNGLAYLGNTPTFAARVGEHVRWHIITLGVEFHVFHIHGHRWRQPWGTLTDSTILGPSTSAVIDYVEDNPGKWLYHCHVTEHMAGGMVGWYSVT